MRTFTLLLLSLSFAACSSPAPTNADAGDGATDVTADVSTDADSSVDATSDTALDTALDTAPDAAVDARVDSVADATTDVSVDAAMDGRPEPFCDIPAVYTYGPEGGLVAFRDSVRIEPGRQFTYTRTPSGRVDAGVSTCTTMINFCGTSDGGTVDTLAVINALNDSDVMAAFGDQASTLYGCDNRPIDGQLFAITRGDGRHFEIGAERGDASGCRAIPAGLARLRMVLTDLQTQQLARPECAGARP